MKRNNELEALRSKILKFNEAYERGSPIVDDIIYDFYKKKLKLLEEHQKIKISDYVGTKNNEKPIKHLFPILSLEHDFGYNSIKKYVKKIEKHINPFPLIGELKIDGLSIIANYYNGKIQTLKTRGNGLFGEDISHLIPFLNIPNEIYLKEELEIRFEAFFEKGIIKNPRNAAAGCVLKKNPDEKLLFLNFAPHNLYSNSNIWTNYIELRNIFSKMHLNCIQPYAVCNSLEDCIAYFKKIEEIKNKFTHEIDGVVFKVNDKEKQDLLGNTAKAPKFAFAIKFSNSFNISEIKKIEFQVGRNGRITPLAKITPTEINNRIISKATLNNLKDLEKKRYAVGDVIRVEMAGEVIPKITKIVEKSNGFTSIPTLCPSCQKELKEDYCTNNWNCYQQKLNKLIYFASKPCLNIKHLGITQIEFFVKEGILNYPFDFFEIKNNLWRISKSQNWLAAKSLSKIIESIDKSSYTTLEKFITSIGFPHIAKTKAKEIAEKFQDFETFIQAEKKDLEFLGKNIADGILEYKEKEYAWIKKTAKYLKIGKQYKKYSLFDF